MDIDSRQPLWAAVVAALHSHKSNVDLAPKVDTPPFMSIVAALFPRPSRKAVYECHGIHGSIFVVLVAIAACGVLVHLGACEV